ncbi:hypothetical protein Sango_1049000 [Sesamum angolense]|uniref:Retrotransposon gag domain-containing protein n=1 Tax=Sesamum angolense TaxID=2727404 RepID=A0AAE2BZ38_9LAMI|nr:hypothetical protein Sango_1049000 [Sesamum angolense]
MRTVLLIDETSLEAKMKLVVVHLKSKALQWYQMYMKARITREIPHWGEYVRALNDQFGTFSYEDPMLELVNLKQTCIVQEYMDKFDQLLSCLELLDTYAVSCFLGGLKTDISIPVRIKPKTMQETINLARLQEQENATSGRRNGRFQTFRHVFFS